jgi:hypothetical protein
MPGIPLDQQPTNKSPVSRRRQRMRRLILFLGAMVFALMLSELGLRIAGFTYFNPYITDPELGFTLRPNAEGWWRNEGSAYVTINSQGLRDREHTIAKPANTIRIAVLGDSFAEALQVSAEDAFWSVMERELQKCSASSGKTIEVINFGVSGFSTARELIMLRQRVWQYQPDVVVLLVTLSNDIKDNSRALSGYTSALPYFVYRDGSLVLDNSMMEERNKAFAFRLQRFAGRPFVWLREHSRLLGLFYSLREAYEAKNKGSVTAKDSASEPGINEKVFQSPANNDWESAWNVTEGLMVQMRDEVEAKGARFLIVTGSASIQVTPNQDDKTKFIQRLNVPSLFYPDTRIKELGIRHRINVLTLAPILAEFTSRTGTFLHGFGPSKGKGHWNESGHALVGKLITERLCDPGWVVP